MVVGMSMSDRREILLKQLRVLEELEQLEEEGVEEERSGNNNLMLYDVSGMRRLTDLGNLEKLRRLVWPGG